MRRVAIKNQHQIADFSKSLSVIEEMVRMREAKAELDFIRESNRIEGIHRDPTPEEVAEHNRFMSIKRVTVKDLERFVKVYQPDARLRDKKCLDVRVGSHLPPRGCAEMRDALSEIIDNANRTMVATADTLYTHTQKVAFDTHLAYEMLHPFTDGNGRSGRMLWLWQMRSAPLGFLHTFYYQTLSNHQNNEQR